MTICGLSLRPLKNPDFPAVISLWHHTMKVAYPYLPLTQAHTIEEDEKFFREVIVPNNDIWIAVKDEILGFLAIKGTYIDRLYIRHDLQRLGVGSFLINHAKDLSPSGLELFTHQKNISAGAFYEKHGFKAVSYGVIPPPENEPDVKYRWEGF